LKTDGNTKTMKGKPVDNGNEEKKDVKCKEERMQLILPQSSGTDAKWHGVHVPQLLQKINVKKLNSLKHCSTATRPTSHN